MGPTIQLIQLTLRIEGEAERQRRDQINHKDDFVSDKPIRSPGQNSQIKYVSNPHPHQHCCECAKA